MFVIFEQNILTAESAYVRRYNDVKKERKKYNNKEKGNLIIL